MLGRETDWRATAEQPPVRRASQIVARPHPPLEQTAHVVDSIFGHPRLAEIYDALEADRRDLDAYVVIAEELGAGSALDIGCGTGTFACLLAARGMEVTGLDPANASLDIARRKPGANTVRWIAGDVTALPPMQVDLVTMTGNVAQVFTSDTAWRTALDAAYDALRPGGHLVFETRDPRRQAWRTWTREHSIRRTEVPGVGTVESWVCLVDVGLPFVRFRWTYRFESDGTVLTSDSTIRFRSPAQVEASLRNAGLVIDCVRDAPDRPGLELVFITSCVPPTSPTPH